MSKAKPDALQEGWAEIDKRSKPSKAASTDPMRPVLQHGFIDHRKGGSFLCVTNSYVLVEIPITIQCPKRDRKKVLPGVHLIPQALKALDRSRTGRFRISDGLFEVDGEPALYPVRTDLTPIAFKELVPDEFKEKKRDGIAHIGFNPKFMARAAEALGVAGRSGNHAVRANFIGPMRPMLIEPLAAMPAGTRALVMPVRLGE